MLSGFTALLSAPPFPASPPTGWLPAADLGTNVGAGRGPPAHHAVPTRAARASPPRPAGGPLSASPVLRPPGFFTGLRAHLHFLESSEMESPPPGLPTVTSCHLRPVSLPPPLPRDVRPHAPQAPWPRRAPEAREPGALYPHSCPTKHPENQQQAQDTQEIPRAMGVRGGLQGGPELLDLAARGDLAGESWGRGSPRADGPCSPSPWGAVRCSSLGEGPPG